MKHGSWVSKSGLIKRLYACRSCNTKQQNKYYHSLKGKKKKEYIEKANRWLKTTIGKKWHSEYMKKYYSKKKIFEKSHDPV